MKRYDKNKISYSIDVNFLSIPVPRICYHLLICISQKSNAWHCKPRSFDEKFRFFYKHSLIWLISVRDLKGLLFFAWIFIPIKDLLISMFSFSSWPRQNFTSLMKLLALQWMKRNGMCIKKVYWIIGINIYESRIA